MPTNDAFCDNQWPATTETPPTGVPGYVGLRVDPPSNHAAYTGNQPWSYSQLLVTADLEHAAQDYNMKITTALEKIITHANKLKCIEFHDEDVDPATVTLSRLRLGLLQVRWTADLLSAEQLKAELQNTLKPSSIAPLEAWWDYTTNPLKSHYKIFWSYLRNTIPELGETFEDSDTDM